MHLPRPPASFWRDLGYTECNYWAPLRIHEPWPRLVRAAGGHLLAVPVFLSLYQSYFSSWNVQMQYGIAPPPPTVHRWRARRLGSGGGGGMPFSLLDQTAAKKQKSGMHDACNATHRVGLGEGRKKIVSHTASLLIRGTGMACRPVGVAART